MWAWAEPSHDEILASEPMGEVPDEAWNEEAWPPEVVSAPWQTPAGVADVAPGPELAMVLDLVDNARVDDRMLVETIAAWERVAAWAHLNAALAAGELSRRGSMNPNWNAPAPANANVAADELAMRLAWSKPAANRLVRDGRALGNELLLTADAVRDGRLDSMKLRTMTDLLADRAGQLAWTVQEAVLDAAAIRTPSQLGRDVERALLAADPADAADRLARGQARRRVCHPKRLPDGMAGFWAVVPAGEAVLIDATLDTSARAAKALGHPGTIDQIRAEHFAAALTGRALLAGAPSASAVHPRTACVPDERTAPPQPAASGVRLGRGIRLPKVRVDVTVALSTLLGLDEQPGELAGFGPISAEQARALAAGGTWRRLVTDPLSGRVLDVGRTRYAPPADLVAHVRARDQVCAAPGCATPAHRCDIDHTTEYHGTPANGSPERGTTSAANLGPLSERCHRLKTDGGFQLWQVEPGVFEWRTPAGLAYRVTPGDHGHVERLNAARTPRLGRAEGPDPGYPDEPPF